MVQTALRRIKSHEKMPKHLFIEIQSYNKEIYIVNSDIIHCNEGDYADDQVVKINQDSTHMREIKRIDYICSDKISLDYLNGKKVHLNVNGTTLLQNNFKYFLGLH